MDVLHLEIVTPEGSKLSEDVREVTAPGVLGELGILPGHIPVITVLDIGALRFTARGGAKKVLAVNTGYMEVDKDQIIVITETAEFAEEIDVDRARASLERANKRLSGEVGDDGVERAQRSHQRATTRLKVAGAE